MILDTCALLWLAGNGDAKISEPTLMQINNAPEVFVSAISGFEVGVKVNSGKLQLPASPKQWFETVLEFHGIEKLDLDLEACLLAVELPPIHKDPCDRLIIAAALIVGMPIVTTDRRFEQYGVQVLC
jgi:PIN domain nuclease of toxin-antitoxin system